MSLKKSIVNFLGPVLPLKALKPSKGTLEVPVTNWKKYDKMKTVVWCISIMYMYLHTYCTVTVFPRSDAKATTSVICAASNQGRCLLNKCEIQTTTNNKEISTFASGD